MSYNEFISDFLSVSSKIGKFANTTRNKLERLGENLAPILLFLVDNEDRIENFLNDFKKLNKFYDGDIDNMPTDQTIDFVTKLIKKKKIQINEDWTIDIINGKKGRKLPTHDSIQKILNTVRLFISVINGTFDLVDNISSLKDTYEEKTVIEDAELTVYYSCDEDSKVIDNIKKEQEIKMYIEERECTLILYKDSQSGNTKSGWIKK